MKTHTKGFIGIGFIIAIIVALGAIGGVSYYSAHQKIKENTQVVNYQTPTNSIKGTWINAREEDTENTLIYRNSKTYTAPPSRFRHYFIFKENNICSSIQLAQDDAQYLKDVNCSLTTDEGVTFLNLDNEKYYVISQSDSMIVLQKINTTPVVVDDNGEKYCSKDSDCACGVNIKTKSCFAGNKKYVDITKQCPDFCSGIVGNLTTKCVNNLCKQITILVAE
jgi:hypothetical protein